MGECGDITVLPTVESTNTYAKQKCTQGIPNRSIIIACEQTAGRGRQGRTFYSPRDGGLYMSIVLKADCIKSDSVQLLTVCAAVAVRRALENICGIRAQIKWVNDIFYASRKICGILCEAVTDIGSLTPSHYIAGIGINIGHGDFPEEIRHIAGSVSCNAGDENLLAADIINQFFNILESENPSELIAEYKSGLMVLNKTVEFVFNGETKTGVAVDINQHANLIVRCADGEITLFSGEITLGSGNFSKK